MFVAFVLFWGHANKAVGSKPDIAIVRTTQMGILSCWPADRSNLQGLKFLWLSGLWWLMILDFTIYQLECYQNTFDLAFYNAAFVISLFPYVA